MNGDEQSTKSLISKLTTNYWDRMGRLNLLSGITAAQKLRWEVRQLQKNREAEEAAARRAAWGEGTMKSDDEMGDNIILGDNVNKNGGSSLPAIALAALAASIPAAAAGYLLANKPEPQQPSFADTDTDTTYSVEKWTPGTT